MSSLIPLTNKFRADSYFKAFLLNAIATALIATFAIELRLQLNEEHGNIYYYFNYILSETQIYEYQKLIIVFIITFLVAILVYQTMYILFEFGGGMMINDNEGLFF